MSSSDEILGELRKIGVVVHALGVDVAFVRKNQETLASEALSDRARILSLEERRLSDSPSKHDLKAEAAIAAESLERKKLAADIAEIREDVKAGNVVVGKIEKVVVDGAAKLIANPGVRLLLTALAAAFAGWFGSSRAAPVLPPSPAPIVHSADGGGP